MCKFSLVFFFFAGRRTRSQSLNFFLSTFRIWICLKCRMLISYVCFYDCFRAFMLGARAPCCQSGRWSRQTTEGIDNQTVMFVESEFDFFILFWLFAGRRTIGERARKSWSRCACCSLCFIMFYSNLTDHAKCCVTGAKSEARRKERRTVAVVFEAIHVDRDNNNNNDDDIDDGIEHCNNDNDSHQRCVDVNDVSRCGVVVVVDRRERGDERGDALDRRYDATVWTILCRVGWNEAVVVLWFLFCFLAADDWRVIVFAIKINSVNVQCFCKL